MKAERLQAALNACGAVLKRNKKHLVFALPNGKTLTVSQTPSDSRAEDNALADLRHALGTQPKVAVVGERRERRVKQGRVDNPFARLSPIADALKASGVHESSELMKAREVEKDLRWRLFMLAQDLQDSERARMALERMWVVRAWSFVVRFFRR